MLKGKVLPVWQEIGQSTNQLALRAYEKYGFKTTHTGTLDPMAEGVIILLIGEERFNKNKRSATKKTYEFEILLGVSTDSYDGMGLILQNKLATKSEIDTAYIKKLLKGFEGEYSQKVPLYSSIRYEGRMLHQHAQSGKDIADLPIKSGTIFKIELLKVYEIPLKTAVENIINKVSMIRFGEFRQNKIINQWKKILDKSDTKFIKVLKIRAETSRGLYVRSLSQDICEKIGIPGLVYTLVRTKNGAFTRQKCKKL